MTQSCVANLHQCWASLDSLLADLSPDEWATQSLCPDWTVAGVVIHLIAVEEMLLGADPSEFAERLPFDVVGAATEAMSTLSPAELLARFRDVTAQRRSELAAVDDAGFATAVMTPVGPGTYGRFMDIRVFDHWVHEQDIRRPLTRPGHESGPSAERSIDEIRMSLPYIVGKRIGASDGASIRFELTGPVSATFTVRVDGRAVLRDDALPVDVTVTADSTTFALLACGRIDPQASIDVGAITWAGDHDLGERAARNLRFTM